MSEFIAQICLFIEQKPERSEDCQPVLRCYSDNSGLLAVFDGAGGAGGTSYPSGEGNSFTGAFLASRLGKKTLIDAFDEIKQKSQLVDAESMPKLLEARLKKAFKECLAALVPASASKIVSSLIRHLPTTMAAVYYEISDGVSKENPTASALANLLNWNSHSVRAPEKANCAINVFWAGDSRCYLLTKASGLQQLTEDDLKTKGDALTNLIEDSPMSNFINADVDFNINFRQISVPLPTILIAATDGCFNFVASPAHFEFLLLKTLHFAETVESWQAALTEEIKKITGDDATLSLASLGFQDFNEIKQAFQLRLQELYKNFIVPLGQVDQEICSLKERLQARETERKQLREKLWRDYKPVYESYLLDGGKQ